MAEQKYFYRHPSYARDWDDSHRMKDRDDPDWLNDAARRGRAIQEEAERDSARFRRGVDAALSLIRGVLPIHRNRAYD